MATTVLVAGESLVASDVRAKLVDLGYDVPAAPRRDEAMRLVVELAPSLVLVDAGDIDAAREIVARVDVPFVVVGELDDAALRRALRAAPGYLPRPFDARQLRTTVEVAIHKHRLDLLVPRERWYAGPGDALVAIDAAGTVTSLNAAAALLARDPAVGRPGDEVFEIVDRGDEGRGRLAAVERFHVRAGEVACFTDVTEELRRERRLPAAEGQAGLGPLVAGMAHAINSPLAAVIANGSMCADDVGAALAALDRGGAEDARRILAEVADMLRDSVAAAHRIKG